MKKLFVYSAILLLCSCAKVNNLIDRFRPKPSGESVVTSVGSDILYKEDVRAATLNAVSTEDSIRIADEFIKQWVTQRLVYQVARQQIGTNGDIEEMVDDYRRSLYIHQYEQQLLAKRMSKEYNPETLLGFYEREKNAFVLDENILKGILLVVPVNSPHQDDLMKWLHNYEEDIDNIEHYAYQFASVYQMFTDNWQPLGKLTAKMPIDDAAAIQQLKNKKTETINVSDSASIYLLRITDKYLAGEVMPFDYAEPLIKQSIMEKRKLDFLKSYEQNIYHRWKEEREP